MSAGAKVGVFIIVALILTAWFILRIQHVRVGHMPGVGYVVDLHDAEGLQPKAWVLYKGVRVGRVTNLTLEGEGVAVDVTMQEHLELHEGTSAKIVNVGLLGEKNLELIAGPSDAPMLPNGAHIPGRKAASLDRALEQATDVGANVQSITEEIRTAVGGPDGGTGRMEALIDNLNQLTIVLRETTSENRRELHGSLEGAQEAARAITELAQKVTALAEREDSRIDRTVENAEETSKRLREAAGSLQSLAEKIDHGDGAVGRLVSSPETGERFDAALTAFHDGAESVSQVSNDVKALTVGVNLRGDYLAAHDDAKGYFGVTLGVHAVSLHLEAVTIPTALLSAGATGSPPSGAAAQGLVETTPTATVTTAPPVRADSVTWTAQMGYRWPLLRARIGFMESRIGAGADSFFFDDRLRLSADLWDISRTNLRPHARLEAAVIPLKPIFVVGGWDDALNVGNGDSFFIGAGLQFGAK